MNSQLLIREGETEPSGAVVSFTDITERKQAEAAMRRSEELYRTLVRNFPNGAVFLFDRELRYLVAQGTGLATMGICGDEIEGKKDLGCFDARKAQVLAPIYEAALAGKTFTCEVPYGDSFYEFHALPVKNEQGEIVAGMVMAQDITNRKQAESALQQQYLREQLIGRMTRRIRQSLDLETMLNTTVGEVRQFLDTDRVLICRFQPDWSGTIVVESVDEQWMPLLGSLVQESDFSQRCISYYQQGHIYVIEDLETANLAAYHRELLIQLQVQGMLVVPIFQEEQLWGLLFAQHCRAPRQWQPLEIDLVAALANQLAIAIQQAELYQQLALANQELQRLVTCDCLTDVANRRRFDEYVEQEWERAVEVNEPLSLLLCDVDFFKVYNDTFGHQAGDECLKQVAAAIRNSVGRMVDLVARYGGEEFAVVLPNMDSSAAWGVAQAIREAVKSLCIAHIGGRWGMCHHQCGGGDVGGQEDRSVVDLIAAADRALYQAKAQGRNRCFVADQ